MRRRLLAATAAGVAAAVLTACGDMHPGAAVVINDGDYRVSMEELDDLTAALCEATPLLAEASGQPTNTTAGVDARQYVASLLIYSYLTPLAADEVDAEEPDPADLAVSPDDYSEITAQMDQDRVDEFFRLLELSNEVAIRQTSIGIEQPQANQANAAQLGQQYVLEYADDFDIDIDPRLGIDGDNLQAEGQDQSMPRSGSLSVAESGQALMRLDPEQEADMVEALPPSQACG
jgi:hypothetical protein